MQQLVTCPRARTHQHFICHTKHTLQCMHARRARCTSVGKSKLQSELEPAVVQAAETSDFLQQGPIIQAGPMQVLLSSCCTVTASCISPGPGCSTSLHVECNRTACTPACMVPQSSHGGGKVAHVQGVYPLPILSDAVSASSASAPPLQQDSPERLPPALEHTGPEPEMSGLSR